MEKAQMLYNLIELVIFFVPVGSLIWRAARTSARLDDLEHDLNGIGQKSREMEKRIETISENYFNSINELKIAIANINISLEYIKKSLEDAKK